MPPEFCLFLDENHCNNPHLLHVLEEQGIRFERYLDHFAPGVADTEWLPFVGAQGWALLTTDKRIRYRNLERRAVQAHNVAMYCFSTNNMNGRELASALKHASGAMQRIFVDRRPPYIAMIRKSGDVIVRESFGD